MHVHHKHAKPLTANYAVLKMEEFMKKCFSALVALVIFALLANVSAMRPTGDSGVKKDPHTDLDGGASVCWNTKTWACGGTP